ncbi:MAG: RtcB family protein [Oscillospiraceae bacterium]|nr:RtcB family protein [Oscillospiraceae bacterium]
MFELNGKYGTAKIFTDNTDDETISQLINLLNQEFTQDLKIRIMPDTHAGKGCVIGTTMTINDKIVPNLVGVDIGCGMKVVKLAGIKKEKLDLNKLDEVIRSHVPSGFDIREKKHRFFEKVKISSLHCADDGDINFERAEKSLGSLGGGNHFIEINEDEKGDMYLVIHSGSRYLGKQVAKYYQDRAWNRISNYGRNDIIQNKIKELKEANREKDIQQEIMKLKHLMPLVPKELAYVETDLFDMYIDDMKLTQEYAYWNREAIAETIMRFMNLEAEETFQTIHNYIDTEKMILRKGAVSAEYGEKLIIPINMRDGSLICVGKGNPDWNNSAPHGAGRIMSRAKAKEVVSLEEYEESMKGIYTTCVGMGTIDESPMAYKPMQEIMDNIQDTVEIVRVIKPVYNFKAGG